MLRIFLPFVCFFLTFFKATATQLPTNTASFRSRSSEIRVGISLFSLRCVFVLWRVLPKISLVQSRKSFHCFPFAFRCLTFIEQALQGRPEWR